MKRLLSSLFLAAALLVGRPAWAAQDVAPEKKPNIVLIFIDDMGYGDIGPYGSKKNRTPNLDQMAKEGMKLTSFYAAPVCSVSRAQVVTGCYGQRVSISGVLSPASPVGINKTEHTIGELMRAQGYATMCIGKWHLGDQPEFLPTRHGFDHYFGLPYSNDMIKKSKVNGQLVVPLVRDTEVAELLTGEGQDHVTERYTDEALKFITANKDRPFFLYMPHTAVHVPIHPGEKFRDKSANGRYGDWVEEVDWSVGKILGTLRDLKLAENTLVMFSSDNGPWLVQGKNGGEAGPLRGGKGSTWEGGMREPTLAWWPGKIAPGTVCDAVAGNIDFLPTFVSLAGGSVPADNVTDGRDFSPLLFGKSTQSQREAHYYYQGYKLQAVRVGPWKLTVAPQNNGMGMADGPVFASLDKPRLYNLDQDIGEKTDVAEAHPDVIARLKPLLLKMAAELGDGKPGPQVREPGRVKDPVTLYPTEPGGKGKTPAKNAPAGKPGPLSLENLKIGDRLTADMAPQVNGRSIAIACTVETNAKDGVIVAHGGASAGYAIYLKQGRVVFAVRTSNSQITRITSPAVIGEQATLSAHLAADGAMTLSVDGKEVASGKSPGLLPRQPAEAFCVGHDEQVTVDDYDGGKLANGTITDLKVTTESAEKKP